MEKIEGGEERSLLSQATNGSAHLYNDSNYAHFSQITEANKSRFPSLSRASPITFTLKVGDALYIPAKWWHWVKSYGNRCVSINYWFSSSLADKPIVHQNLVGKWPACEKWTNQHLIEVSKRCNPDGIWLWRDQFAYKERIAMQEFIDRYGGNRESSKQESVNNKKEFAYLITLSDYECHISNSNRGLLEELSHDIEFPFASTIEEYGCNFWMNFGGIDTGLHYDDEDGLLCVVDGTKIVTLYPPSDSVYLAPYPAEPVKLLRNNRCFMYNLYKEIGPLPEETLVDSSSLLEITLRKAPNLAAYTRKLQDKYGAGRIVYGIKNCDGVVKWEFYFYGIDRFCSTYQERKLLFGNKAYNQDLNLQSYLKFHQETLRASSTPMPETFTNCEPEGMIVYSVDFDEESAMSGSLSKINLYRVTGDRIQVPFILSEHTMYDTGETVINSVQYINLFEVAFSGTFALFDHCKKLGMKQDDINNLVKFCDGSPYKCKVVSIVNKREEIGIYFFGICYEAFALFLVKYRYPPDLLDFVLKNATSVAALQLEVGFHFRKDSDTAIPSRTAIYGLF